MKPLLLLVLLSLRCFGDEALDAALDAVAPELKKWATVCVVSKDAAGTLAFEWEDYRDTGRKRDFWPASTIKLYTAVAALELLNERRFPLNTLVLFEHREKDGRWVFDCARSVREMFSEIFRRSSNEDYTLLLRMVGIDRINTELLTPERGFPHSALMRGYVLGRPYGFVREEAQRITLRSIEDGRTETFENVWSGRYYAEERGCTVIDVKTGNVTSPRELAECLRRILFHEKLPPAERYNLTAEQLQLLRHGADGLTGLETKNSDSGPSAWTDGVQRVFPDARFFHKSGIISNYALELAAVDDTAASGAWFIFVVGINAGEASKPVRGDKLVGQMAQAIARWVQQRVAGARPAEAAATGR